MARLLVPVALFTMAFLVMRVAGAIGRRQRMRVAAQPGRSPALLVHSINDDRCTGCEACVSVCPTDVLELVSNHARPLRFDDCIQCNQCEWVCPTKALVMHLPKEKPPAILLPALDEFYQTNISGLYLIGEAGGKPLTKNASNLGRAVVEHMRKTGLRAASRSGSVDVLIIGSGPGGLSAALTCMQHGLSYACIEKDAIPFSTVARYPKGKWVMAEPYDVRCLGLLPVWDAQKDDIVREWNEIVQKSGVKVDLQELVQSFKGKAGDFQVVTSKRTLRAQRIVVATGTRGRPRKLKVPGENLPKVKNLLDDPDEYCGKEVLVVGGGDSAAEAVIALVEAGAGVTLSYRGKQIMRANPKNREKVEKYIASQKVRALWSSEVTEIQAPKVVLKLEGGRIVEVPNDAVITLIGADPPVEWLKKMGIQYVERPHMHAQPKSDELVERLLGSVEETTRENVYALLGIAPMRRTARRTPEPSPGRTPGRRVEQKDVERVPVIPARAIPPRRSRAERAQPEPGESAEGPQDEPSGSFFDAPTRAVNFEAATRAVNMEMMSKTAAPLKLDTDAEMRGPWRSRRVTPESLEPRDGGRRASDLSRAAREARARAHATGEIKTRAPEEAKTTLLPDDRAGKLRRDSRKAEQQERLRSELPEASEDGLTRVRSPLGAWGGLPELE